MHVMEYVRQRLDAWSDPMRRRPMLAGSDIWMLRPQALAALAALPNLYRITPDLGPRLGWYIDGADDLLPGLPQSPAAIRTAPYRDGNMDQFRSQYLVGRISKPEESLARLTPGWLGIRFARAFGKWCRPTSAFQLFHFRPQLFDHPMLVQNDLNQFVAAQRFQRFQDPGCTNLFVRARTFKLSNTFFGTTVANQLRISITRATHPPAPSTQAIIQTGESARTLQLGLKLDF
jgi:hypothetical protein